jgi:hypothetical protein
MTVRNPLYRSGCNLEELDIPTDQVPGIVQLLSLTAGVNGLVTGTTNLFTAPQDAIITGVIVEVTTGTAVTVPPILGVGVASGEADVLFPALKAGLSATGEVYVDPILGIAVKVASGETVKLGIDTGGTGTTLTLRIHLIGYLIPS